MHCIHTMSLGCKNCQPVRKTMPQQPRGREQVAEAESILQPSLPLKVEHVEGNSPRREYQSPTRARRLQAQAVGQTTLDLF